MIIGLIILGAAAILVFFGVTERALRSMGIANWVMFLLIIALVMGVVMPRVNVGMFALNLGGFLIPLAIAFMMFAVLGFSAMLGQSLFASVVVGGAVFTLNAVMPPHGVGAIIGTSIMSAVLASVIAALICRPGLGAPAAAITGIIAADFALSMLNKTYVLGFGGVFDAIIISALLSVLLSELIAGFRTARARVHFRSNTAAATAENAEDNYIERIE